MAPRLPAELLAEALQAARAISDEEARAKALAALAPRLPAELLAEALQAARAIGAEKSRLRWLRVLAECGQEFIRAEKSLPATLREGNMSFKSRNCGPRRHLSGKDRV